MVVKFGVLQRVFKAQICMLPCLCSPVSSSVSSSALSLSSSDSLSLLSYLKTIAVFSQVAILTCVNIPNMIQLLIYLSILQVDNKLEDVSFFVWRYWPTATTTFNVLLHLHEKITTKYWLPGIIIGASGARQPVDISNIWK